MVMLVKYGGEGDIHEFGVDIDDTNLPSRREALSEISKPVAGLHARAKRLPPDLVAQTLDNEPFEDFPGFLVLSMLLYGKRINSAMSE